MGIIALALFGIATPSCSIFGTDINDLEYNKNIVGKWKLTGFILKCVKILEIPIDYKLLTYFCRGR